ncbi:hypothetical protein OUZ56_006430 [Daphnia magna]|uniref:Uncharacterized protein n=1 Tax=Daphnia magna TaxID=35525 RepID=A0ABQ9YVL8_9CRUS|nr:hypothetical protein OUZ56_006430 [Daphnia magna]
MDRGDFKPEKEKDTQQRGKTLGVHADVKKEKTAGLLFSREIEPMSEGARKPSADTPRKPLSESQI